MVLGVEIRASCQPSKHSLSALYPQPSTFLIFPKYSQEEKNWFVNVYFVSIHFKL